ncbi:MAG: Alanine racemase 1 [Chlamydiae bacterium]|nr:Alanine racemase 1 [Chlamydiota bacterium]
MPNSNRLTINLQAIQNNLAHMMAELPSQTRLMAMVKANGYGTDLTLLAQALSKMGIHCLGVAHVLEGIQLRERNITLPIFVIHTAANEVQEVIEHSLEVAVYDPSFCHLLNQEALRQKKQVKVHLDITTGMNRFGCPPEKALELAQTIHSLPSLDFEGVMTHFVAPEIPTFDSFSREQIEIFKKCIEELALGSILPPWIHASNTAAIRRFDLPFCNMVRVGIGLFQPENVLTLESRIASIHQCNKGENVGYLCGYRIKRDEERIAVISIGYHDGIDLRYSGKGYVLIHGKKAPMIGLICMDFMMVDVTDIPEAQIGDSVLIFGKELPIQTVASWATPNVRELMTALGPRIERHFIHMDEILESSSIQETICSL